MAKTEATARIKINKLLEMVDCDAVVVGDVFAASRLALGTQEAATRSLRDMEV
jgi:hypothetical protein